MTHKSLTFGLDFDDTFTACPELWVSFIRQAQIAGHRVIVVTCRRNTAESRLEIREFMERHGCDVQFVCTDMGSKCWAMNHRGIHVDIWIDDEPNTVMNGR